MEKQMNRIPIISANILWSVRRDRTATQNWMSRNIWTLEILSRQNVYSQDIELSWHQKCAFLWNATLDVTILSLLSVWEIVANGIDVDDVHSAKHAIHSQLN